jgi:selenide,water dikinase
MGGKPLTAMNIVCFPSTLPLSILSEILKGGADKVLESGATLVGGHSVKDKEVKYGLSVTGTVHPDKVWINSNLKENDVLILTKPLGTGILTTALKRKAVLESEIDDCIQGMLALNKKACDVMLDVGGINACTDITGFGFLGHLKEMCVGSNKGALISLENIQSYNNFFELAEKGFVPGGCKDNLKNSEGFVEFDSYVTLNQKYLLSDPQTSGGLLISVSKDKSLELIKKLKENNVNAFVVGIVTGKNIIKVT